MEDDPLALATRRRIYEAIARSPGSGGREVQRSAGTAWGETVYHLERLTDAGLVHRERGEHQDHYYVRKVPLGDRRLLALVRSRSARRILVALLQEPEQTVADLVERTGLSTGRISVHLRRFLETGIVRGGRRERLRTFDLAEPTRVAVLLVTYSQGFADEWIERQLATWSELFRP
ncbi:MAG: winged helix-turn-helix transcriptional regulator [Thermoplasmata archaeon]|nr:winged helix-turn-helix transcriptional regulator [Thermoplasmata archaeon]